MDALIVVAEPGRRSLSILAKIKKLATDINVGRILAVGNKVAGPEDEKMIRESVEAEGLPLLGMVPLDDSIKEADRTGMAPIDLDPKSPGMMALRDIKASLVQETKS
jgi:CO dehydrogenase maturation factor